ncbi:hypothetical protein [Actinocorallia sp. A-T 12471]|uniref:hypothetical protein n=1 Tax=Actinocorallia sp. A-T 12471 TaxID=3089813 RepID=UPI0029CEFC64|nr:hypothetical protein [Actinocorallia sp. A-T 12471]MDX6740754.1 hypothetical protein [Actinocorallia sp. A-T 12471]
MVFTLAWIGWIAAFVVIEGVALARRAPGDTLSEHVWRWLRVRDARPTPLTWALRLLLVAGGVWLTGHLAFGWWSL